MRKGECGLQGRYLFIHNKGLPRLESESYSDLHENTEKSSIMVDDQETLCRHYEQSLLEEISVDERTSDPIHGDEKRRKERYKYIMKIQT